MTIRKKSVIIALPLLMYLILRLISEIVSIQSESVLVIPFLGSIAFVLHCVFPFVIIKYFRDIKHSRTIAFLLVVLIGFSVMIDMFIMYMLRYESTLLPEFLTANDVAIRNIRNVSIVSNLVSLVTGIFAIVAIINFRDMFSKTSLLFLTILFMIYHFVELTGMFIGTALYSVMLEHMYTFNVLIGSLVIFFGFKELDVLQKGKKAYEYN